MGSAPIELLALDDLYPGVIGARRQGEPSFTHVQDIGDAYKRHFSARRTAPQRATVGPQAVAHCGESGAVAVKSETMIDTRKRALTWEDSTSESGAGEGNRTLTVSLGS